MVFSHVEGRKGRTTICVRQVWFRDEQFRHLPLTQEELPQSLGSLPAPSETHTRRGLDSFISSDHTFVDIILPEPVSAIFPIRSGRIS